MSANRSLFTSMTKRGWPIDPPAAGHIAVIAHPQSRLAEAAAVAEGYIDAGIAETHDVGTPVAVDVDHEARMLVDIPTASGRAGTVIVHPQHRLRETEAGIQRHIGTSVAEAYDVDAPVAIDVGEQARVQLHPPAAGIVAIIVDPQCRWRERVGGAGGMAGACSNVAARSAADAAAGLSARRNERIAVMANFSWLGASWTPPKHVNLLPAAWPCAENCPAIDRPQFGSAAPSATQS